ncbi:MAG: hypothetical protein CVT98_02570 [Bacteroidetes bacterium HGW-Bacteroidetes-15]|nr:MAG: hypothetical protein CVT98_02570 [Bacteroidetes bacterium HGW-Bacteroidetes-15]
MEPVHPTAPKNRILEIDFVRGFALLGILLVNMALFKGSVFEMVVLPAKAGSAVDIISRGFIYFFAEGKFYSLFSLLFGLGFSIFILKEEKYGVNAEYAYLRRIIALMVFGIIHAFFIWSGDILLAYSILGLILIAFKNISAKGLIKWAVGMVAFILVINTLIYLLVDLITMLPNADMIYEQIENSFDQYREKAIMAHDTYSGTNYLAMIGIRAREVGLYYSGFFNVFPSIMSMFLIGFALGKSGKLNDIEGNKPFFRKLFAITLLLGLPLAALNAYGITTYSRLVFDLNAMYQTFGLYLGAPILALAYFSGGILLFHSFSNSKFLIAVASAGRMALTNYLMQSIICTTLFYGYGFGLFGKISVLEGIVISISLWLCQLPLSYWWLKKYKFGPAEWLWRSITYKQWQSNKL